MQKILRKLKKIFKGDKLRIKVVDYKKNSWLKAQNIVEGFQPPKSKFTSKIDYRRLKTKSLGEKPLWEQYEKLDNYPQPIEKGTKRSSSQVSTQRNVGNFYTWLVSKLKPEVIVEFGTAFGVSGMYWLAGLETNGKGKMYTFEPNTIWAEIADKNLSSISDKYQLIHGTFEENFEKVVEKGTEINLAFIDAIHTSEFVNSQYDFILPRLGPHGIVIFDDIDFSEDMRSCWEDISHRENVLGSFEINGVGVVEVK